MYPLGGSDFRVLMEHGDFEKSSIPNSSEMESARIMGLESDWAAGWRPNLPSLMCQDKRFRFVQKPRKFTVRF